MKNFLRIFIGFTCLNLIALIIIPPLIKWNHLKPYISELVEAATEKKLTIDGEIGVTLFPFPKVNLSNIRLNNQDSDPQSLVSVTANEMIVKPSLWHLLQGKLTLSTIIFRNANILIRWDEHQTIASVLSSRQEKEQFIDRFYFENATLSVERKANQIFQKISNINANIYFPSNGPFTVEGSLKEKNLPISFKFYIEKLFDITQSKAKFTLNSNLFSFTIDGSIQNIDSKHSFNGTAALHSKNTALLASTLLTDKLVTSNKKNIPNQQPLSIEGPLHASLTEINWDPLTITSEAINGDAHVKALIENIPLIDVVLNIQTLNLDSLLASSSPDSVTDVYSKEYLQRSNHNFHFFSPLLFVPPKYLNLLLYLTTNEVIYNKQTLTNLVLNAELFNGEFSLYPSSVVFPNNALFTIAGHLNHNKIRPIFTGNLSLTGENFDHIVRWLNTPFNQFFPSNHQFSLSSKLVTTPKQIHFSEINATFDKTALNGLIEISYGGIEKKINTNLSLSNFNSNHFTFPTELTSFLNETMTNIKEEGNYNFDWLRQFTSEVTLELSAHNSIINQENFDHFLVVSYIYPGLFKTDKIAIKSDHAHFSGSGELDIKALRPKLNFSLQGETFDTAFFSALLPTSLQQTIKAPPTDIVSVEQSTKSSYWSNEPVHFVRLDPFDGLISLSFENFLYQDLPLENLDLQVALQEKYLLVHQLKSKMFGGNFSAKGNVTVHPKSISGSFGLTNARLEEFLSFFIPNHKLTGYLSISGSATTQGATPEEMIHSLRSNLSVATRAVTINNLDFMKIIDTTNMNADFKYDPTAFANTIREATSQGQSFLNNVDTRLSIANNLLTINGMMFDTTRFKGILAGNINLYDRLMNLAARTAFIPQGSTTPLNIDIHMKGKLDNPDITYETTQVEDFLRRRAITSPIPSLIPTPSSMSPTSPSPSTSGASSMTPLGKPTLAPIE